MSGHGHPLGVVASLDEDSLEEFDDDLRGALVLPDGEEYEDARNVWNGLINTYPAVVARVKGATDVARAISFARGNDFEISIRGGAHHPTGALSSRAASSSITHRSVFVDGTIDEIHDIVFEQKEADPTSMAAIGVWPLGGNVGHGPDAAFAWDDKGYMITVEGNREDVRGRRSSGRPRPSAISVWPVSKAHTRWRRRAGVRRVDEAGLR